MEFLLQMFADLLGTPSNNEVNARAETEKKANQESIAKAPENKEQVEEEKSVIFGLIQFH